MAVSVMAVCLWTVCSVSAQGSDWSSHRNDSVGSGRSGWSFSLPDSWVSIPDVIPGWPHGEGWRTRDGKTSFLVAWLPSVHDSEYETLRSRHYLETTETAAGKSCRMFRKIKGPSFEQVIYLPSASGVYRISAFGSTRDKAVLQKALDSFTLTAPAAEGSNLNTYSNSNLALTLTLPSEKDARLETRDNAKGFTISAGGTEIIRATPRTDSPLSGQSFRGLARQIGRNHIPDAQELTRFEPRQIADYTSYLAVWKTGNGSYVGPIIYIPYKRGSYTVLEIELLDPKHIDTFFKVVDTLKFSN